MKLTKIVATLGPATETEESIKQLLESGVNVVRFNFKHGEVDWHKERVQRVRNVANQLGLYTGILIDLQGPEVRGLIGDNDGYPLTQGQQYPLVAKDPDANKQQIAFTHPDIIEHLQEDQLVMAADGAIRFKVRKHDGHTFLESLVNAKLGHHKTFNFPGAEYPLPLLTDHDYDGIKLAADVEADYIALSFVRTLEDIQQFKQELTKHNANGQVVAKIENQQAINNLKAIIKATDTVMVARGDLGVELPIEQVPYYTKKIIKLCNDYNKPVITATQMLMSMVDNELPTRAEVTDIANAAFSHSDAVMLSDESAMGKHPIEAVQMMARTATYNEQKFSVDTRTLYKFESQDRAGMLTEAAYDLYLKSKREDRPAAGFIVFTHSGLTAHRLSGFKPQAPIIAVCPSEQVARSLSLRFGVQSYVHKANTADASPVEVDQIQTAINLLITEGIIENNKKYIILYGDFWSIKGGTSTLKVITS